MAESTKKVFDVSSKTSADPTSRPIIMSHSPIMRDPTLTASEPADEGLPKEETKTFSSAKQIKIQPLDEDLKTEKSEIKVQVNAAKKPAKKETGDNSEASDTDTAEAKADPQGETTAPTTHEDQPEAAAKVSDTNTEAEAKQPAKNDNLNSPPQNNAEQLKQEAAAAEEALAHSQHIADIVASQKFYLPINRVEKRKNRRAVVIGAVLCIILAVAWLDVAFDAGIISDTYNLPHTHFFTVKPLPALSSPSVASSAITPQQKSLAEVNIAGIHDLLAEYDANNGYYPGTLDPAQILPKGNSSSLNMFTPPTGVKYLYKVSPTGCTTEAKNCQSYTLNAVQTANGSVIASQSSPNQKNSP